MPLIPPWLQAWLRATTAKLVVPCTKRVLCVCISFMQCSLCFFYFINASEWVEKKHVLCIFSAFKTTHHVFCFAVVLYIYLFCSRGLKCSGPSIAIEKVIWDALKKGSDGVEYSTFKYRVLALRIFEYEYWWLTSSTSITSSSTFFAVELYILKLVAGIRCLNWNQFFSSCLFNFLSLFFKLFI